MKILSNKAVLLGAIVFASALIAVGVFASSPFDIEFPISELGDCADKNACKTYCDDPSNLDACTAFSEKHGLGTGGKREGGQKRNANEFLKALEEDGGPDGVCGRADDPLRACEKTCNEQANMEVCLEYALKHDLMVGEDRQESEKVLAALQRGIKPPCANERECKTKCEDPATEEDAEQCLAFGVAAGFVPAEEAEQARKMFAIARSKGKSLRELRTCEKNPTEECIDIALEAGIIKPEEVEMAKTVAREGGPGGCRGRECGNFCNKEENQEACFKWASERGLIREEDKRRMEEGLTQIRTELGRVPEAVKTCVLGKIPELQAVLDGSGAPLGPSVGRKIGEAFQACFAESGEFGGPGGGPGDGRGPGGSGQMPPEVAACLKDAGIDMENVKGRPSPEMEATMRACFEKVGGGMQQGGMQGSGGAPSEEMKACVENATDEDARRACFEQFGGQNRGPSDRPMSPRPPQEGGQAFDPFNPGTMPPFEGGQYPEGTHPSEGVNQQFNQQFQEQYQQQQQQQFQQQYQNYQQPPNPYPSDGSTYPAQPYPYPPQSGTSGFYPPPPENQSGTGNYPPPPSGTDSYPSPTSGSGSYPPPPEGGVQPPPPPTGGFLYVPSHEARVNPPTLLGFFAKILGIVP